VLGHARFLWNALAAVVVVVVHWERLRKPPWALAAAVVVVSPYILHP
jgi:hypothetical protein